MNLIQLKIVSFFKKNLEIFLLIIFLISSVLLRNFIIPTQKKFKEII